MTAEKRSAEVADDEVLKRVKLEVTGDIKERDAGITLYLSDLPGFTGQIKQRYTDFLVNEITMEGEVVHLVDK